MVGLLFFALPFAAASPIVKDSPVADMALEAPKRVLDATLERIAVCESNNNPNARNPDSSASGRFQFLTGTWEYYGKQLWGASFAAKDVFSIEDNTELAYYVVSINGYTDWASSKPCWLGT